MRRQPARLCSLFILAVLSVPSSAHGKRVLVVARSRTPGAEKAAALVEHFLSDLFDRDDRHSSVDVTALLGAAEQKRALRALQTAQNLDARGRSAFQSLDLQAAVQHLNKAVATYTRNAAYLSDVTPLANTLMTLGAAHLLRGEQTLARRKLGWAAAISPDIKPDPRMFSPPMRETFERIAGSQAGLARGQVTVVSTPPQALVMVDSRLAGVTPLTVEGVAAGKHLLTVSQPGHRAYAAAVEVMPDSETPVTAALRPLRFFEDFDRLVWRAVWRLVDDKTEGDVDPSINQVGSGANADLVVVAAVGLDGDRVQVRCYAFDLSRQRALFESKHVFGYGVQPQLYQVEMKALYNRHFTEGGDPVKLTESEDPLWQDGSTDADSPSWTAESESFEWGDVRNWAYGAGGVGLVLMAAGGLLWRRALQDNLAYRDEAVQGSEQAHRLRSNGQTNAIVGDVLFSLGVAATSVGGFLFFTW